MVRFPDGLKLIGAFAFYKCALKEIVVPDGCGVPTFAFSGCGDLTKVAIGASCPAIGEFAFSECEALTRMAIGDGCASISSSAFDGCKLLVTIGRLSSVVSAGQVGFGRCTSMATLPKGCPLHKDAFCRCASTVTRF
jgi:hypothetical protein